MKKVILIILLFTIWINSSCSIKEQDEKEKIISIIFNSQIGNEEHFGQSSPVSPLISNFEELERYEESARKWGKRMNALERKIILLGISKVNNLYKEFASKYLKEHGFEKTFLGNKTNWDKLDIKNESKYALVNFSDFPDLKLDSIHVGVLQISDVGFNQMKNKAVVYYDWLCLGDCGYGNLVILKREDNEWQIEEIFSLWAS